MSELELQKIKELEQKIDDMELVVKGLTDTLAKWRHAGLRGLDTGDSLGDIVGSTGNLTVDGDLAVGADGSITVGSGGTLTMGDGSTIALGSGSTVTLAAGGSLVVNGDITIGATGQLIWGATGQHYIDNDLMHFDLPPGDERSTIEWRDGAAIGYYSEVRARQISSTNTNIFLVAYGATGSAGPRGFLSAQANAVITEANMSVWSTSLSSSILADLRVTDTQGIVIRNNQTGAGNQSRIINILGGTGGSEYFIVADDNDDSLFYVSSNGTLGTVSNDATGGAGAYVRRIPIVYDIEGTPTLGYLRIYAS